MKTVLLLLVIALLLIGARLWMRRGIAPAAREAAAGEEQALIVTFPVASTNDVKRIHALEDELSGAIKRSSAGDFDGDEVGNGNCVLYMYGPSAERLFEATIQILRDSQPPAGSFLIKRFGKPGARQERVELASVEPEDQKRDLEKLLGAAVSFAEQMLKKEGEFYPYGATMNGEGKISHEGGYTGSEHPRPTEVIDLLKGAFRAQAEAGEIKACALVYDVRTVPPGRMEKTDAVEVDLDHRGGMSISVIYPYLIAPDKTVTFSQSFAIRGKREVFESRPGDVGSLPKNAPAQP